MKGQFIQGVNAGEDRWNYGSAYVKHSTTGDGVYIAERLRDADRNEISALTLQPPVQVLTDGINASSPCYTVAITATDEPCAIFGVRESDNPNSGVVWMLGTDALFTIATKFLRASGDWVDELHTHYTMLFNVIDARNEVHIKWLKWLGFSMIQDIPKYGIERRKFILFNRYDGV